jgi:sialate O-acetylesterase
MTSHRLVPIAAVLILSAFPVLGEVKLPKMLGSHMVLQRDQPIHLWGWSEVGEKVSVQLNGVTQTAVGDRLGHWSLALPPQPAGGPFQLTIQPRPREGPRSLSNRF